MAVSQKQIAEKLGVSIALVSRVLSGKATEIGIAPATIERVMKTAKDLGYVPSAAALSLKGKATRTIGVAVLDFNDPFFSSLIEQIQIQAREHDYSLVLAGFINRVPDEQDLQPLHKHAIEGLIVLGSDAKTQWLEDFSHLPIARLGHGAPGEPAIQVSVDENSAAEQLIRHLTSRGRNRLMYISRGLSAHRLRQAALEKAAAAEGRKLTPILFDDKSPFASGLQVSTQLLEDGTDFDALICATDQIAMGALHALHNSGIRVPEQVAVTGFDDIAAARQFIPPITTIRQPIGEMVRQAFDAVTGGADPQEILLPGELIIRQST